MSQWHFRKLTALSILGFFGSRVYECSYFLHFASLGGEYKRLSFYCSVLVVDQSQHRQLPNKSGLCFILLC